MSVRPEDEYMVNGFEGVKNELKQQYIEELGYWSEAHQIALQIDPQYFEYYMNIIVHPHEHGHLSPKIRELMLIAVNCVTTQLYNDGTRIHIGKALERGATFEEIAEVLQRASGLGIHSLTEGVPLLMEIIDNPDLRNSPLLDEQRELKERFEHKRGFWSDVWEDLLRLDPDFFNHYIDLSSHPYEHGPLEFKVKEFISIAYNSSTTNLFLRGLEAHMENALSHGADPREVMEVLELTSIVGFHTLIESAPILMEEAAKRNALPDSWETIK